MTDEQQSKSVSELMTALAVEVKAGQRTIEGVMVEVYALGMRHGGCILSRELGLPEFPPSVPEP